MNLKRGDTFPHALPHPGQEGNLIFMNGPTFCLVSWLSRLSPGEISDWDSGDYLYGAFIKEDIPFLIVGFTATNLIAETSLNVVGEKERGNPLCDFMTGESDLLTLIQVEAETNIVRGIRKLIMGPTTATALRGACTRQLDRYATGQEVQAATYRLMDTYDTNAMVQRTQMYRPS